MKSGAWFVDQNRDDPRSKEFMSVAEERMRRQGRLHSAVARIYYLTARLLENHWSTGRQMALTNVLKFVRNTQAFLTSPDMRDNYTLQRLRRYFCSTVEHLFDGLSSLKDSDRFIPAHMPLTLYRLCEEWCQFGPQSEMVRQRYQLMERAAASGTPQIDASEAIERFKTETRLLSFASVGALAALSQKAYSPPPATSASSPTERERHPAEYMKPLTASSVLERLSAILSSPHEPTQVRGKKALKSLLLQNTNDSTFVDEALKRAIVMSPLPDQSVQKTNSSSSSSSSSIRFFEVITGIVCNTEGHCFSFSQVVVLGLANLCHCEMFTRRQAFNLLEAIHQQSSGILTMSQFAATVGSLALGSYVHAHRVVADFLAGEHPSHAADILDQLGTWLTEFPDKSMCTAIVLRLLQSLEFWISNIQLMTEDRTSLSTHAFSTLFHLVSLSRRYGPTHTEQITMLWAKLVEPPNEANGHATVRFLLEQSHKVGSTAFINCAENVVASLCQTSIGPRIFEELCSVIEPARMLPTIEHRLNFPDPRDLQLLTESLSANLSTRAFES